MPPKLTPERIQEKLGELRAYVTDHVDVVRTRSEFSVLQKLRQTASKEEKAWSNFLTKTTSAFTAAHVQHLACTYDLINEASAFHQACTPSEGADGPDLPSEVVMASGTAGPHREFAGQPGFTTCGQLIIGGIHTWKSQRGVLYRWRRQINGAADILAPWRDSVGDALDDYVHGFRAQE